MGPGGFVLWTTFHLVCGISFLKTVFGTYPVAINHILTRVVISDGNCPCSSYRLLLRASVCCLALRMWFYECTWDLSRGFVYNIKLTRWFCGRDCVCSVWGNFRSRWSVGPPGRLGCLAFCWLGLAFRHSFFFLFL